MTEPALVGLIQLISNFQRPAMRASPIFNWITLPSLALWAFAALAGAQDAVVLHEKYEPGHTSKVDVVVKLTGKLAVPLQKGKAPELVTIAGVSRVTYEERVLVPDDVGTLKAVHGVPLDAIDRARISMERGTHEPARRLVLVVSESVEPVDP